MSPAFKEWSVIIEALGSGQQIVILRKGGIAEKRGGFALDANRFWLFPTRFHAQPEKTKPSAAQWLNSPRADANGSSAATSISAGSPYSPDSPRADSQRPSATTTSTTTDAVTLRYFADVVHHVFLSDWTAIAALDAHHFWTEEAVREKFEWDQPAGLHVFVVRIHRLATPITLPLTSEMSGCKSWIDLPADFNATPSAPVLDEASFSQARAALGL